MLSIGLHCWAPLILGIAGALALDEGPSWNVSPSRPAARPASQSDEVRVVLKEDQMTIKDKPLTIDLPLNRTIRSEINRAIARYPDATVRLSLRDVRPPSDRKAIHGFNIFLNKPDATASTPEDDPHYVRAMEFAPTTQDTSQEFTVDVLRTLGRLHGHDKENLKRALEKEKALKITIVAIPAPGVPRIPKEGWFSVHELGLSVPHRARR